MLAACWSSGDEGECIRVRGAAPDADVRVRPALVDRSYPATAGRVVVAGDGDGLCFVPRFAFVDGAAYAVEVDGTEIAVLDRRRSPARSTTTVVAIEPPADEVPRNLLRFSVTFSAPMAEGGAAAHIRVVDDRGDPMVGVLLPMARELWDASRRRLTVLLDPARIKRGLAPHREAGYPLELGSTVRLVVDGALRDAAGAPLVAGAERRYRVIGDERRRIDPASWRLASPRAGSLGPLVVTFDRPLDRDLVRSCLQVVGTGGRPVVGDGTVGDDGRSWSWTPAEPWAAEHVLVVDPALEDLAGNSVRRVFDRDLDRPDDDPVDGGPALLTVRPV